MSTNEVIYGEIYYIQNGYLNWQGGYLDTCGLAQYNLYDVSTASTPNRDTAGNGSSGKWKILSATGKQNGTPVLYGDLLNLQNQYNNGQGGYLDVCNKAQSNLYAVSTASTPNRDTAGNGSSGKWKILSATGKQDGTPVLIEDVLNLQNQYNNGQGGYLDVCNKDQSNLYDVSTASTPNRDTAGNGSTGKWRFIALTPKEPAQPPISKEPALPPVSNDGTITTEPGKTYKVRITVNVPANIGYKNTFGIFAMSADGSVSGVKPGDANYAATVVKNRLSLPGVDEGSYQKGQTFQCDLPGGPTYAVFLIANGTPDQFLANNPQNQGSKPPLAYFFNQAANPDGKSHIKVLSPNEYGFEDVYGGGDQDFDDLIVKLETVSVVNNT